MTRLFIWLVTIVGLVPVIAVSIWSLRAHALYSRVKKESLGGASFLSGATLQIGRRTNTQQLRVSAHTWPAVVTICGACLALAGTLFLLPGEPRRFYSRGLSRTDQYVRRVAESRGEYASVIIARPDSAHAVLFARRGREALLCVFADLTKLSSQGLPSKVTDFFAMRGIRPRTEEPLIHGTS